MSLTFATTELSRDEISERRQGAIRSGNPAWLWPEVAVAEWAEALQHIGAAASSVLAGEPTPFPECEPQALSVACYTSGTGPLLGWWLEQGQLSASSETSRLLALHLHHSRERAAKVKAQSREVVSALVDGSVPVAVLKGGHTAYAYFPDPATRPASDLDLLVPSDFAAHAEVALAKCGFECLTRSRRESSWRRQGTLREPRSAWLVHEDDPWGVDLHRTLDFSWAPAAPLARFDSADPVETSDPWPLDSEAGALSQPLLLLHLTVHASGGLHSLTLLRMIEIVLVARQDVASGRLSWNQFLHSGAATNALGPAYPALSMAEKLAPGTVPAAVLEICAELAPPRVRAMVEKLEPATAHRVERASVAEHFMWVGGFSGWCRQLASDIAPRSEFWSIYRRRAFRLLRGRVSR